MIQTVHSAPRRLSDVAYGRIKEDIVRCTLTPGVQVTEAALARRYRLGKAPVRAALLRLSQHGLVRSLPRHGYLVAPVTLKDFHDVFELRLLLEPAAAERAAGRVDGPRLRRLDALCRAGYTPANKAQTTAFLQANKEFHVTIARAAGNERLAAALAALLDEMERIFHIGLAARNRTKEMQHEHKALVDALIAGNGPRAREITIEQIEAARTMVLDAISSSSHVLNLNIGAPIVAIGRRSSTR
jgi:DNA-binding GntR family transcriptional regulator